jgi:2-(1,2-epoxy-1,2-dihydrophenyl)acetyl-CoA isomerase
MKFETLLYEVHDGVARIKLNREKAANAIDLQMAKDLMYAALQADEDPSVRVVLIGATGKMFCAGGDLGAFTSAGDEMPRLLKEITTYLHAGISRFARMRAPVIASVAGTAAGAGFSLICSTDLAICGESAKFTMAYTRAGLTPDGSSTYFLPRLIGTRRSLELMLTNRVLRAQEALDWGLVTKVVPDDDLMSEANALAKQLASGATNAYGVVKRLLIDSYGMLSIAVDRGSAAAELGLAAGVELTLGPIDEANPDPGATSSVSLRPRTE